MTKSLNVRELREKLAAGHTFPDSRDRFTLDLAVSTMVCHFGVSAENIDRAGALLDSVEFTGKLFGEYSFRDMFCIVLFGAGTWRAKLAQRVQIPGSVIGIFQTWVESIDKNDGHAEVDVDCSPARLLELKEIANLAMHGKLSTLVLRVSLDLRPADLSATGESQNWLWVSAIKIEVGGSLESRNVSNGQHTD